MRHVVGQGSIAAIRVKDRVFLLAATTDADLRGVVESHVPVLGGRWDTDPQAQVPMYLDRWDRLRLSILLRAVDAAPTPNGRDDEDYDPTGDFTFARDSGHSGIVLWTRPNSVAIGRGDHQRARLGLGPPAARAR